MSWYRSSLIVAVVGLFSTANAVTIYVDDDNCPGPGSGTEADPYCSIQTAIDDAVDTDEIVVGPGTYIENIDFLGKAVTLRSSHGDDVTIIDGQGSGTVVTCDSGEGPDTVLEGFTLTGGTGTVFDTCPWPWVGDWKAGGGMLVIGSSPTVAACTFSANHVTSFCTRRPPPWPPPLWHTGRGGGMYNNGGSPTLIDCNFAGNTTSGYGGGMYSGGGNPTVTNCTFEGNTAGTRGGGMHNDESSPTVTDCTFSGNLATWGGGMFNQNSSPTVTDCMFSGNSTSNYGGGMYNANNSNPTVTDCTFSGNSAEVFGGGGMLNAGSNPMIVDCTFSGNTAANRGGGTFNIDSSPTVTDCRFSGNSAGFDGGGMYNNVNSNPTITDSRFCENTPDDIWGDWDGDDNTFYTFCRVFGFDTIVVGVDDVLNLLDH